MAKETKQSKTEQKAQEQREVKSFLMWTAGITVGLVLLIYILYSTAIGG
jgi:hypothetical protein